eukprot:scaffold7192_cov203-Alexandrium_tamarense.AAC.7
MDLLQGYNSSSCDDDDNGGPSSAPLQQQPTPPTLRRPPPGALNAAPRPSVPVAVLRSKGVLLGTNGGMTAMALTNNNNNDPSSSSSLHTAIQGPALLCDPNDKTTSFVRSIDPKTGSTAKMEANAAVDEYMFSRNRNAFQRGSGGSSAAGSGEVALAPGETVREIVRNDYGYDRRFPPPDTSAEDAKQSSLVRKRLLGDIGDDDNNNNKNNTKQSRKQRRKQTNTSEGSLVHNSDDELTFGIWAPPSTTERLLQQDSLTALESGVELDPRIAKERAYLAERDRQRGLLQEGDNEKEKFDRM